MGKIYTDYDEYLQVAGDWWQWLEWDQRRQCVVGKPQYTFRQRLCKKYNLKLK